VKSSVTSIASQLISEMSVPMVSPRASSSSSVPISSWLPPATIAVGGSAASSSWRVALRPC
jgi:hypothetical protein